MEIDRRELLRQFSLLLAGVSAASCKTEKKPSPVTDSGAKAQAPAPAPPPQPEPLDPDARALKGVQKKTMGAAIDRILPGDDKDPGATQAGVLEYVDRELARPEFAELKKHMLAGIVALNRLSNRYGERQFYELEKELQDEVLAKVQHKSRRGQDFVQFLVLITLEGFLGDPKWGGNANGVGWKMIGYGPGHVDGIVTRCNDDQ